MGLAPPMSDPAALADAAAAAAAGGALAAPPTPFDAPAPSRPDYGMHGKVTQVLTNFNPISVNLAVEVYQHNVQFHPELKLATARRRVLLECEPQLVEHLLAAKGWAYDGDKILYTLGPMRLQMIELVVGRAPKETKVTIRQVSHHRMQELHTGSARRDDMRPVRARATRLADPPPQ